MWKIKTFKTYAERDRWVADNEYRYQITRIFINRKTLRSPMCAVEYRKLRWVY